MANAFVKNYSRWVTLIPKICEEYKAKYPLDSSGVIAIKSELGKTILMMATNEVNLAIYDASEPSLLRRWQEISPEVVDFMKGAKIGDIYVSPYSKQYSSGSVQHYRNTPPFEPANLGSGKVIVDFGFVDFGIVVDGVSSIQVGSAPTLIYAFDKEPFAIAKSLVMMQMMRDPRVSSRSLVEVWMSTLWTSATLHLFRSSLATVILTSDHTQNDKVMAIFQFWEQSRNIKAEEAKEFWTNHCRNLNVSVGKACNLTTAADRVEFMRYSLTGAVYEDCESAHGSIVMCTENKKLGVIQGFDCCIQAAPPSAFYSSLQMTLMDRAKSFFETQIGKIAKHIRVGTLIFIPRVAEISLANKVLLTELKLLDPFIVSWSNLCDYVGISEFHAMAKMISCPDTVHYMHSCNWSTKTYGSDIYDIKEDHRLQVYEGGIESMKFSQICLGFSKTIVSHFRNICSVVLIRSDLVAGSYLKHFFRGQEVSRFGPESGMLFSIPSITTRDMNVLHIIYSYDKDMVMKSKPIW